MATPEEEKKKQEELNKLLQEEIKILRETLSLQSDSYDLSSGLVDALKETLGIRSKQTTFENTLLSINKDINKAILNQKSGLTDINSIQKQISKNEELILKAKLTQISLEKSIGEEGKKKTKIISDLFTAQKDLQNELQAELDKAEKGLEINQSLVASTQKQIELNDKAIQKETKKLSSLEQQYIFNKLNTAELEEQNEKRKKEKEYIDNINKSMGLTGALASGLETTLNKLGLNGLSQRLGINNALTQTKGFSQQITAGSNGVATMGQKFQIAGNLIKNIGSSLIKNLTDPLTISTFLAGKLIDLFKFLINSGLAFSERTAEISRNFAISTKDATLVNEELSRMVSNSTNLLATQNNLRDALFQINEQFGTSALLTQNTLEGQIDLTKKLKLSNEESSIITSFALQQGTSQKDIVSSITKQNSGIINNRKVIQEVAKVQGQLYAQYKGSPELIAKAVVQTQKLGITLQQAQQISKGLLEFETSIGAELEAELLTGKQLNLEQARYKALMGDSAGAAAEVLNQVGGIEEFSRLNVIQQAALAKSIGLSADELANSLRTQQILTNLGEENVKAYDEAIKAAEKAGDYDKARSLEELKNKGKKFDMAQQELGAQEKFNAAVDKLKALLVSIVEGPMGKMAEKLVSMVELIAKIPGIGNIIGLVAGLGGSVIAAGLAASLVKGTNPLTAMWVKQVGVPGTTSTGAPGVPGGKGMRMGEKLGVGALAAGLGGAALDAYSASKKEEAELLKSQGKAEEAKKAQTAGKTAAIGGSVLGAGASALSGASIGAMIGSIIPGVGTAIGGAVGGIIGGAYGLYENRDTLFGGDNEETETPMAKGGIITKPTKILAGEAGAEGIIPLNRNSLIDITPIVAAINELGKKQEILASAISNKPITIESKIELDGQQVAYNQSTGAQSYRT